MLINICYRTYSWFLSIFWLLSFKECINLFLSQNLSIMHHCITILCWSIFAIIIYSWFLTSFWLLTFRERVDLFLLKHLSCLEHYWNENFMLINRTHSWLWYVSGLLTFKNGSCDHDLMGEFVSLTRLILFGTAGKKRFYGSTWFLLILNCVLT